MRLRLATNLLAWYRSNKRDLPWRGASVYSVWISEVMLQQTQVATVIPFFLRFMKRFPTVESLAEAPLDEVLKHWAGLGYYARARNLHRAAQVIVSNHGGRLPETPEEIERLPGIGRYTAGAILSIAYNVPRPIVDANVIRVLSRVFGVRGDPKSAANQATLWSLAEQLIPEDSPGDFNQGLMELGALICRPDEPLCERCPLLPDCIAGNSPDPTALPEIPPSRATIVVTHSCAIIPRPRRGSSGLAASVDLLPEEASGETPPGEGDRHVLLVRRLEHGLWGGLWEFPRVVCERGELPAEAGVRAAREVAGLDVKPVESIGVIKHTVTHHRIALHAHLTQLVPPDQDAAPLMCSAAEWVAMEDLDAYPCAAPQVLLREALKVWLGRHEQDDAQGVLGL